MRRARTLAGDAQSVGEGAGGGQWRNGPITIGGSADLTPSNNTKTKNITEIAPGHYQGRYVHYGIREHAMAAAMNGMALHGGVIPYSGTFFVFSDYCRPAIRLAALMGIRVIHVMTHDSIGLGTDGPTHQPIEHLASLRAIPQSSGDASRRCGGDNRMLADRAGSQKHAAQPDLAFSRQNVTPVRHHTGHQQISPPRAPMKCAGARRKAKVTLLATGSELGIALAARDQLAAEGIASRIVSMPCWDLFEEQSDQYRREVLGPGTIRIAIEAAAPFGWDRYIGPEGAFIGMHSFGASGPYKDLYRVLFSELPLKPSWTRQRRHGAAQYFVG